MPRGSKKRTTNVRSFGDAKSGRKVTTVTDGRKTQKTTVDRSEGPGGVQEVNTTTESGGEGNRGMSSAEQFVSLLFLLGAIGVYLHYRPQVTALWSRIVAARTAAPLTTGRPVDTSAPGFIGPKLPIIPRLPGVTPVPAISLGVPLPVIK